MNQVIKKTFIATVAASVLTAASASAISQSQLDFFAENNIYFYDPESTTIIDCTASLTEKVLYTLIKDGYTEIAAAGIYSNLLDAGLRTAQLFEHANEMDSDNDIDTYVNGALITYENIHSLYDININHPFGLFQVNYTNRVNLLKALDNANFNFNEYAGKWDEATKTYVYDSKSYNELLNELGKGTVSSILEIELSNYMADKSNLTVSQTVIDEQNLSELGIVANTKLKDALNKTKTATQAAELFYTVATPTNISSASNRAISAESGYKIINGVTCSSAGGAKIAQAAIEMSWPFTGSRHKEDREWEIKPEYNNAITALGGGYRTYCQKREDWTIGNSKPNPSRLDFAQDCGVFVGTVLHYTKVDTNPGLPRSGTSNLVNYFSNSENWMEISNNNNTNNLEPGDVFVYNDYSTNNGHTYIYVGDGMIASASACNRTAELWPIGWEGYSEVHNGVTFKYRIFRFVGK